MCTEGTSETTGAGCREGPVHFSHRDCFLAEPEAIRRALGVARERFAAQLPAETAGRAELALAEVLNNVGEHGYRGRPGPVCLCLGLGPRSLFVRIEDQGCPMPGNRLPAGDMPDVAEEIADLAEGGWGWALIRLLTADLEYRRQDNHNLLTFRIPLASP